MKKFTFINKGLKIASIAVFSLGIQQQVHAQGQVAEMMQAGAADASKLVAAYMGPTLKGFGAGMNTGWYNTAKPHGLGRFDLTFSLNAVLIPDAGKTFDASQLGFSNNLQIKAGTGPTATTLAGSSDPTNNPVYQLYADNPAPLTGQTMVAEFSSPKGLGVAYSGAPTLQLAVGLVKNTEVMFRYIPTVALGDFGEIGLMGFGLKHDIKQWIPVVSKMPFDMSAYFGYTKFNANKALDLKPSNAENFSGITNSDFSNQEFNFDTKATTFGLILSKKIAVLTVYGAVNYQTSKTILDLKGNYPITVLETQAGDPQFGTKVNGNLENPVSVTVDGANGVNATLGARLKLLILTINGSYTFAEYPVAALGIGLNIDWK